MPDEGCLQATLAWLLLGLTSLADASNFGELVPKYPEGFRLMTKLFHNTVDFLLTSKAVKERKNKEKEIP